MSQPGNEYGGDRLRLATEHGNLGAACNAKTIRQQHNVVILCPAELVQLHSFFICRASVDGSLLLQQTCYTKHNELANSHI